MCDPLECAAHARVGAGEAFGYFRGALRVSILLPDFVNKNMTLEKVYLITHKYNSEENKFERLILSVGKNQDDSIIWKEPSADDFKEFQEKHHIDKHTAY